MFVRENTKQMNEIVVSVQTNITTINNAVSLLLYHVHVLCWQRPDVKGNISVYIQMHSSKIIFLLK